jgi:membrane associated rhomboid family serine protease
MILFAVLVLAGYAVYVMSPQERDRLWQAGLKYVHHARSAAIDARERPDPFRAALHARTPLVVATPGLIALNVLVFLGMLFGSGALSDPATLIGWGANFGPRTTNGEWSRLWLSLFVHAGLIHLLVNIAGMAQVGLLLERMLGPIAVTVVFFGAGIFASLENVSSHPIAVSSGAAGAIFGLYGLLAATVLWTFLQRGRLPAIEMPTTGFDLKSLFTRSEPMVGLGLISEPTAPAEPSEPYSPERPEPLEPNEPSEPAFLVPLSTLKRLAPAVAIFLLYSMATDGIGSPELSGLVAGFACGLVLASGVAAAKPGFVRLGATTAAALIVAMVSAFLLRGLADVRPEMARVVAIEGRTTVAYKSAVEQFKLGTLSAEALAKMIDQKITPELVDAQARLKTLGRVPPEHQPLVASAEEYLRLRDASWRQRAAALHKSNMGGLRQADKIERASLEAFQRIADYGESASTPPKIKN